MKNWYYTHSIAGILFLLVIIFPAFAQQDYEPGLIYVKYTTIGGSASKTSFKQANTRIHIVDQKTVLQSVIQLKNRTRSSRFLQQSQLRKIYKATIAGTDDMELAARLIEEDPAVEYAEPVYQHRLFLTPNDPLLGENGQSYLQAINANAAWDSTTGDSSVVIGIIDTGTRLNHVDLVSNRWQNPGETGTDAQGNERATNNMDDDNNGFIDDADGWDFVGNDNNPDAGSSSHGTHVTGIAAAETDNSEGVASLGFNTQFFPVKVTNDAGGPVRFGFEAMLYAAQIGVDVINASWGSTRFSQFGQDVVQTVTEMGTLVVAAAGNNNDDQVFFPAGYPEVIAVTAATTQREKTSFSSFGSFVDIAAPGNNILSTVLPESGLVYAMSSGTSMAAPIVSALAALIKAAKPTTDIDQIRAQIVASAAPVSTASDAPFHPLELGNGFLQADAALGDDLASIEVKKAQFNDSTGNANDVFETGEVITARLRLKNYGIPLNGASVTVTSLSPETFPLEGGGSSTQINLPSVAHSEEFTIPAINFRITTQARIDQKVLVQLTYNYPDGRQTREVITTTLLPSFVTLAGNTIELSLDGAGHIGFTDFPVNSKGSGFLIRRFSTTETFLNVPLLREGGLLFGDASENENSSFAVSNSIRNENPNETDTDFLIRDAIDTESDATRNLQRTTITFTDLNAGSDTYNILARNDAFAFSEPGHDQYIILQYTLENRDNQRDYNNFRTGLFFDFNLPFSEATNDTAWYDDSRDLIIMQNRPDPETDTLLIGATIAEGIGTPWIIDNSRTDAFFFGINDGFTEQEKWRGLSVGKLSPGSRSLAAGPGDLSFIMGSTSLILQRNQSVTQNFIIAYAFDRETLFSQISNARERVMETAVSTEEETILERPAAFKIRSVYPNPFNPAATISFQLPSPQQVVLEMYNILGRKVQTLFTGRMAAGIHNQTINASTLSSGIYIIQLRGENNLVSRQKVTLIK